MRGVGGTSSRAGDERQRSADNQALEERRRIVARTLAIGLFIYVAFFAVDVFAERFIGAEAGLGWFAAWRGLGTALIAGALALVRRPGATARAVALAELLGFGGASLAVGLMAVRYGGLNSHYIQGVSLIIMFYSAAVPNRWSRAVVISLACAATYPLVMALAAPFEPSIAAAWRTPGAVYLFIHDYLFVLATVGMGAVASHGVWAARRQVFEARKLGRYRLKVRIGAGGSGEVWLATDEQHRRQVALKILDPQAAQRPGARARFEREARAAQSLHDPHTIRVFDYGASDDGVCFIAMEWLDGADLGTLVARGGPMPGDRVASFGAQACASLAEAHESGILHRDIKPENLFATRDGDRYDFLKLLDFGLAKVVRPEEDATLTQGTFVGGTPLYMAPEVCAGNDADARSDLYSLGAVLYLLATGVPPFQADSAPALMMKHLHEAPPPPSRHRAVPAELEAIILRCLAKRPADRFESARALGAALERAAATWTDERARTMWSSRALPILG